MCHSTISIYRTIFNPPDRYDLVRLLNKLTPDAVFVEIGQTQEALRLTRDVRAVRTEAAVIGIADRCKSEDLPRVQEAGVGALLLPPFSEERLQEALSHALSLTKKRLAARPLVFLPAKAGSGSSTTALNVAAAMAGSCQQRVLLIDADLRSGLLATLLAQKPEHSIVDALEAADRLGEELWQKLVVRAHGLDLLASPRAPEPGAWIFSAWDYLHLLSFAMARYDAIVVDLPEVINDATEAIVRQARGIYIVSTSEMPSLILARRRIAELQSRGIPESSLQVVLNRHGRNCRLDQVEEVLHRKIGARLPNDYAAARRATLAGGPISGRTKIARAYTDLARSCLPAGSEDGGGLNYFKDMFDKTRSWILSGPSQLPGKS